MQFSSYYLFSKSDDGHDIFCPDCVSGHGQKETADHFIHAQKGNSGCTIYVSVQCYVRNRRCGMGNSGGGGDIDGCRGSDGNSVHQEAGTVMLRNRDFPFRECLPVNRNFYYLYG